MAPTDGTLKTGLDNSKAYVEWDKRDAAAEHAGNQPSTKNCDESTSYDPGQLVTLPAAPSKRHCDIASLGEVVTFQTLGITAISSPFSENANSSFAGYARLSLYVTEHLPMS